MTVPPVRVGISSCLLGEPVRFDGGHKHDRYLTGTLGQLFQWVPVCPEVELGLGTPRETIQLQLAGDGQIRLVTTSTGVDLTQQMQRYAEQRVESLVVENLSGYILKKDSPSCGLQRVKVYPPDGQARRNGTGLFAAALQQRFPNLPLEDEGRLSDAGLRENWVERVFAYHALQQLWNDGWSLGRLVEFHTRYKFVLLAHSEDDYRQLGRLVANAADMPAQTLQQLYESRFMGALRHIPTPRQHANVLQHMLGFLKHELDPASRDELLQHIGDYRRGLVPLIVPLTLLRHFVRVCGVEYLAAQVYLAPHAGELALRHDA